MSAISVPPPARRHDIDALRVLAFALLILYHCGMFYVADWGWHIKSAHVAEWLQWPMLMVNQWRMSLLFLISGLAVNFLLRRSAPGAFAWSRARRLLVPLLFGMAVVVPPQAYLQALSNGAFAGNYAQFLLHYFTFRPWPPGAFDGSHVGITWNHLWYLPYLLAYSLLLAALLPLLRGRAGRALRERFRGLRGWRLWLLPALPLAVATWLLSARFPTTHDLVQDWHSHAIYFAMFLYGYWIGADEELWAELKRRRWWLLAAALLAFAAFLWLLFNTRPGPTPARALFDLVQRLNAWTWILMVLGWGHHLLNRPFRWLAYASQAVYPWYVLHQTIIVVAGYWLAKLALGPVVEPALVVLATVAGCLLIHEYGIRRVRALRPLFGVAAGGRASPPDVARASCASAS
ncbi:acyltransferase family protein [Luteimonas sp. RD2P54]|uniref:Acyltransferase family protein n=1 Tax=Luteimonas endophytica TaxID=3042023 RepID=A0ABT6JAX7_9GAMM|nr:acyltransferase family protein [Luteimonas endophytica]MDH5823974.1 acyltransferase family protein [Luteimonas endophytica]